MSCNKDTLIDSIALCISTIHLNRLSRLHAVLTEHVALDNLHVSAPVRCHIRFFARSTSWHLSTRGAATEGFERRKKPKNRSTSEARHPITLQNSWESIERLDKLIGSRKFLNGWPADVRFQRLTRGQSAEESENKLSQDNWINWQKDGIIDYNAEFQCLFNKLSVGSFSEAMQLNLWNFGSKLSYCSWCHGCRDSY